MINNHNGQAEEVHILKKLTQTLNTTRGRGNYQILKEFMIRGHHYALVRTENDCSDEAHLFRVSQSDVEEIDSQIEWEQIADAIDEYLFLQD